jgi:phage-related minor tail protein
MVLTFTQLESQFGTTAQIIARGFSTIIGSAVDGVARSVAGLLNLTMTWGEALRNIGTSIVQGIITSFAQMVSEWVISHVLMKGVLLAFSAFGLTLKTKETASTIALETAKTPVLTLNAGLASASSYGAAAFIGLAALIAIIAVLASMSFDTGGYTGSGSRSQPAGIVHREEFVMNAAATSRIGVPTLEAMQAGEPVVAESGQRVSLVLVDSRERAEALDVGESRKQIIQVMAEEMHNFRTG